jgi:N-acetylglutamate synthase-like GNAT family acetyltransferase
MHLAAIGEGRLWVAAREDRILGFVEVHERELTKLFVRGDAAFAGVGRRLLLTAIAAIRSAGARSVYLESTRTACGFYKKHGFVERGRAEFSRGDGEIILEVVEMELDLRAARQAAPASERSAG